MGKLPLEVVATFFLDWGFALGTGLLFGLVTRHAPARRSFSFAALYLHAGVLPIAIAYYVWHPDWMWMYWVPDDSLPIAVVVQSFVLYEVCLIAGLAIARGAPPRVAVGSTVVTAIAGLAGAVAARDRLLRFGAAEDFARGRLEAAMSPEIVVLALTGAASLAMLALLLHRAARTGAILD
ncbi:MAG TPA: hypothetical protein VM600_01390 [Actinomycetota bacterium]|nr:hypothetical protein [Actinomycetota bacterium]